MNENRQKELINYFENDYSAKTDPYFITKIKTEKLKDRIIDLLESYEMLAEYLGVFNFDLYVKALCNINILNSNDVQKLINIISDKFIKIKNNLKYFKYSPFNTYESKIAQLFHSLYELKRICKGKFDDTENKIYNKLKDEFLKQQTDLFSFEWLYDDNLQNFKKCFIDFISVLSYLQAEEKYCYVINIALSKLIVQDSPEFEAVLENFLKAYKNNYGNHVFENVYTKRIMQEIFNKFNKNIPYCYDDLFMEKQIKKLRLLLRRSSTL